MKKAKPVIHGRDHAPDGADPIPAGGTLQIADEGVVLPDEPILNFTGGGVQAVWNPGAGRTDVTVPTSMHMDADNIGSFLQVDTTGHAADGYGIRLRSSGDTTAAVGIASTGGSGIGLDVQGTQYAIKASTDGGSTDVVISAFTTLGDAAHIATANGIALSIDATTGTSILIKYGGGNMFKIDGTGIYMAVAPTIGPF